MKGQSRVAFFSTAFFLTVVTVALAPAAVATHAQVGTAPNSARASSADTAATIPFELVTRHIMVKVKVNNSRPLSFVLDTGDEVGIIDTEVAKQLGLTLEGQVRVGGGGSRNALRLEGEGWDLGVAGPGRVFTVADVGAATRAARVAVWP